MRIRGLNPTLKQSKIMQLNDMDHNEWLVKKVLSDRLECIHRDTGATKDAYFKVVSRV